MAKIKETTGKECFLRVIDTRLGDARMTGIGAMYDTEKDMNSAFIAAKAHEDSGGLFLLDMLVGPDLIDSISLLAAGVEAVTGVSPKSPMYYQVFDVAFYAALESFKKNRQQDAGSAFVELEGDLDAVTTAAFAAADAYEQARAGEGN